MTDRFNNVVPVTLIQEFASGDTCTGVAYTGGEPGVRVLADGDALNGRVHLSRRASGDGAINGGLFPLGTILGPRIYPKLASGWIALPGASTITVTALDRDGVEFPIASASAAVLTLDALTSWDLLPGWSIKVAAAGTLSGEGRIVLQVPPYAQPYSFTTY